MLIYSIADNLPVATRLELYTNKDEGTDEEQKKDSVKDVQFEHGYRLGFTENNKVLKCIFLSVYFYVSLVWQTMFK